MEVPSVVEPTKPVEPPKPKPAEYYWRELMLQAVLLVWFTLVMVGVAVWLPANVILFTTISTAFGAVSGSLWTKLRS